MRIFFSALLFSILFFLFSSFCHGQETKITGHISDPLTNEAIPFASVVFKGTSIGTTSDINGNYELQTTQKVDSVIASFVGYIPVTMPVQMGKMQVINIALRVNKFDLPEVEVKAGENPADIIMREVIKKKPRNNQVNVSAYQYESYNKIEFDVNNITEKFKNRRLFRPFKFVFENVDSSATNKKPFLPVFLTESISDVFFTKEPKHMKEVIKATKISGVENNTISQYLGDFYQKINIYDNYIYMFGKGFVSPLADISNLYYKYYMVDSAYFGDKWCYKLKFKPRRKQELTFSGDMWVNDTTFAIKKISMRIADDANINFIEDLAFVDEYDFIDNQQWMLTKDIFVVNIAPIETKNKQTMGFIARKTTTYKDFILNQPKPASFFKDQEEVTVLEDASQKNEDYWEQNRHDSLTVTEKKIYAMVDTIKTLPAFKTYVDIITILATGYKDVGPIDIGPIFSTYSFNDLEGSRLKFGGRTNNLFSNKIQLSGYGAYGFRDYQFKYGAGFEYFLPGKSYTSFGGSYKDDVEQLGKTISSFSSDNLVVTALSRINSNRFNETKQEQLFYETDPLTGLTTNISFYHRELAPLHNIEFSYYTDDTKTTTRNYINSSEIALSVRYAYHERFVHSGRKGAVGVKSTRISLGSDFPIVKITYTKGIKDILHSEFNYDKIRLQINNYFHFKNFGHTYYDIETGKVWKVVPYPLLEVHKGNETYTYNSDLFNLMNYFEFVSDQFFSVMLVQHFDGFFLDHIPLLRKLKLREVASVNYLIGSISQGNLDILTDPNIFYTFSKPYIEAGVGIENILKILRIDLIKRFRYTDHPNIVRYGFRFSIYLNF
jgi:hypothetical protein